MCKLISYKFIGVLLALLLVVGCAGPNQKENVGTVAGGATGALIGSQFGSGSKRTFYTGLGAIAGAYLGKQIGASMDATDRLQQQQALEYGRSGQPTRWNNPDTGAQYTVTPEPAYHRGSQVCRDYTTQAVMPDGKQETVYGRACRQSDGSWQAVN